MKLSAFYGLSEENKAKLMSCMEAETKKYKASEILLNFSERLSGVAIITKGKAHLSCIDMEGNERILEYYEENDVFGEMFYMPVKSMVYYVTADKDCEIIFINYANIIKRCENACIYHTQLVNNLFRILAERIKQYNLHISLLGQKTLRKKLTAYLEYRSELSGSSTFTIPMSVSELASYLCCDRSALMREITNMKKDNIIASKGRKFKIL